MLLPEFEYHAPKTLQEACEILDDAGGKAKLLAGGTDLIVNMKRKLVSPSRVVALGRVEGLGEITLNGKGTVSIGAMVSAARLAASDLVTRRIPVLGQGASRLGSPLIRNRATIAGNIVTARPAGDLLPPLLALGASVVLKSSDAERTVSLDQFFKGPGETVIEPREILCSILIPEPPEGWGGFYVKLGARKTLEISLVNVAAALTIDSDGVITSARVALGAVAPTPIRSPSAERLLVGEKPAGEEDPIFGKAALAAAADAKPITDHRGSADYRRWMVEVLTKRALRGAFLQARQKR